MLHEGSHFVSSRCSWKRNFFNSTTFTMRMDVSIIIASKYTKLPGMEILNKDKVTTKAQGESACSTIAGFIPY